MVTEERKKFTLLGDKTMFIRYSAIITGLIVFLFTSPVFAENAISGKMVKSIVEKALAQNNISAIPLVNEKKLFPPCQSELTITPTLGNWKTVTVGCSGKSPWKIVLRNKIKSSPNIAKSSYKNVQNNNMSDELLKQIKVGSIKRSIGRGEVITPSDVIEIDIPENKATDIFPNYKDLIGRKAKTTIRALNPVFSRQLETNFMIGKDMQVTIFYQNEHISVQMEGIALEDGQYGDWINVKNIKSGRIILAKVIGEKKVNV